MGHLHRVNGHVYSTTMYNYLFKSHKVSGIGRKPKTYSLPVVPCCSRPCFQTNPWTHRVRCCETVVRCPHPNHPYVWSLISYVPRSPTIACSSLGALNPGVPDPNPSARWLSWIEVGSRKPQPQRKRKLSPSGLGLEFE